MSAQEEPSAEFSGRCPVCGYMGVFKQTQHRIRETFACSRCRSTSRYQVQAEALVKSLLGRTDISLAEAVEGNHLAGLRIYEVGISGPFRTILSRVPGYTKSFFWSDVPPGKYRDGVVCQDLMALTFPDAAFDLVISSDVFEHVRHPVLAFAQVRRVLAPGGRHVFTVPTNLPFTRPTVRRIDVSGPEDIDILPPVYHGDGRGGRSIVYNDFGADMLDMIAATGMRTEVFHHSAGGDIGARCLAFVSHVV